MGLSDWNTDYKSKCSLTLPIPSTYPILLILPLFTVFTLAFFGVTTYISFDIPLTVTHTFGPSHPQCAASLQVLGPRCDVSLFSLST